MPSDKIKTIELNIEKKLIDKVKELEHQRQSMLEALKNIYEIVQNNDGTEQSYINDFVSIYALSHGQYMRLIKLIEGE